MYCINRFTEESYKLKKILRAGKFVYSLPSIKNNLVQKKNVENTEM